MSVNPIPAATRGKILVAAIITGGSTGTVIITMTGIGAPPWAVAAVSSAFAGVGTVAAALSRANLTLDKPEDR